MPRIAKPLGHLRDHLPAIGGLVSIPFGFRAGKINEYSLLFGTHAVRVGEFTRPLDSAWHLRQKTRKMHFFWQVPPVRRTLVGERVVLCEGPNGGCLCRKIRRYYLKRCDSETKPAPVTLWFTQTPKPHNIESWADSQRGWMFNWLNPVVIAFMSKITF